MQSKHESSCSKSNLVMSDSQMLTLSQVKQRQIQDFPKGGGVGCRGYGYFILGLSVVGHITRCTDKMSVDKSARGGGGGGDKMLSILWEGRAKCLS